MNTHLKSALVATCTMIVAAATAPAAHAQSLDSRINSAHGSVGFDFTTKAYVCGNGSSITMSSDSSAGWNTRSSHRGIQMGSTSSRDVFSCEIAPAHVAITRDGGGKISDLRVTVGGRVARSETELGLMSSSSAAHYLLSVAPTLAGRAGDNAVMGAAIADSAVIWKRLIEIARANGATESARKAALFWVSQEATAVATAGLDAVASDDDAQLAVRKDALFFLAQRPDNEGVPALIRVVKESKNPVLRKDAIWHLSQSKDPRALDLFERLLAGK